MTEHKSTLFWPKAFYFFFYAATAALLPFLALYYDGLGLSGRQIGFLSGIPPLVGLVAAPTWSASADAYRRHKLILSIVMIGAIAMSLVLSQITLFALLIPVVVIYSIFSSPIIPLTDHAVMSMLADQKGQYGRQRIWGAVGWGIAAPLIGFWVEFNGLQWSFLGYAAIMLIGLIIVQKMTFSQFDGQHPIWIGARSLFSNRQWITFLFLVFAAGTGLAVIHNYLFLYFNELGSSKTVMGFALTAATISELPVYYFAERLLGRWSPRRLFVFGTIMLVLRTLLLSSFRIPGILLLTQILHGLTFSIMWISAVSYADEVAPTGLGATAQGVYNGVFMGLAGAAGAMYGGVLYEEFLGAGMYRIASVFLVVCLVIYLIAAGKSSQHKSFSSD